MPLQNRPLVIRLRQFRLQRIAPGGMVFKSDFQIIQRRADSFELGGAAGLVEFGAIDANLAFYLEFAYICTPTTYESAAMIAKPPDQKKYVEQFWRKYEVLNEIAPEPRPALEAFISFLDVAYQTWLRSGNVDAQIEADIQHHVDMQKQWAKLRELENDAFRANASRS